MLDLLDQELIYAYWADWDDGPNASSDSVQHLDRARVQRYFTDAEYDAVADGGFLWVGETAKGAESWPAN